MLDEKQKRHLAEIEICLNDVESALVILSSGVHKPEAAKEIAVRALERFTEGYGLFEDFRSGDLI